MNAEIITIGDELLIGQVVDTNSSWMGIELNKNGIDVVKKTTISDNETDITDALTTALESVDIVLITGGLGPTKDDITKKTLCDYFDSKLIFSPEVLEDVEAFLVGEHKSLNSLNQDQAMVPECCKVIRNKVGTAPIMWFDIEGKVVVSMPGVPYEMKAAMTDSVIPELKKVFKTDEIIHKTFTVAGIPESDLSIQLTEWENSIPNYMSLAYLPSPTRVRLRLTGKGEDLEVMKESVSNLSVRLREILGKSIWSENDDLPEVLLGKLLKERGETISCAESCTGGNIAHHLSKHAGSSAFFMGSVTAYDNDIKERLLKVSKDDLANYGAVSRSVVEQMALGVKELMKTDWAVATSGIAGPSGGSKEKPVGTVWIAWAGPFGVESRCFNFSHLREINIISATEAALAGFLLYYL